MRANKILTAVSSLVVVCFFTYRSSSVAQNPLSRPVLFAHGFCGDALDFQPLISSLSQQLPLNLYPNQTVYYAAYDSILNTTTFWLLSNGSFQQVSESSIPQSARFFSIRFYDPEGQSFAPPNVAKISVLNKASEIAKVIKQILSITHTKNVIIVGHSMGGLDARTYTEGMASSGACYDYQNNLPDYTSASCVPGSTKYAGDVWDLISVDTPHLGSPLAALSVSIPWCIVDPSVNRSELELQPAGGTGLIEALNYSGTAISGVKPVKNTTPIQAIEDYFNDTTIAWDGLTGYSDDVVQQSSQSIILNVPRTDTSSPLQDIQIEYASSDAGIVATPDCWMLGEPVLHLMGCLGAQANTQNAIASQIVFSASSGVTTSVSTSITADAATLNGSVNPQNANGRAGFYWSTDSSMATYALSCLGLSYTSWNSCPTLTPNSTVQSFNSAVTAILSDTTYYYRMVFWDTDNNTYQYGAMLSFKTKNPTVTSTAATSVTASSATLNGSINPQDSNGYAGFYWGTDPALNSYSLTCYGGYTDWSHCPNPTANFTKQSFTALLTGMTSNTNFYYRMVFWDYVNNTYHYGAVLSFKTKNPAVKSTTATSVTASGVTLNGSINPQGSNGVAGFYWGTDPTLNSYSLSCYGGYTDWGHCPNPMANFTSQGFTTTLTGLISNVSYYYRMVFWDLDNNTYQYGTILSFKTKNPTVTSSTATSVTVTSATLNGSINPQGTNGYAGFYWGTDPTLTTYSLNCYGGYTDWYHCPNPTANFTQQSFSTGLTGLGSSVTYYYRMVFWDLDNNTFQYGAILSFKTQ